MTTAPLWRRSFDLVEQAVASRLESIVRTEGFAVAVGLSAQTQREIRRRTERATRRAWHLLNLPAGSDVTRLMSQIAELERQVRDLTRAVEVPKGTRPVKRSAR